MACPLQTPSYGYRIEYLGSLGYAHFRDSEYRRASATLRVRLENSSRTRCAPAQRKPDQSSVMRMELLGLAGSYLMLVNWPEAMRSKWIRSSRLVMS